MIIFSWNINGFNTCNQFGGYDTILEENPDFICFQEVKISDPEDLDNLYTIDYEKYYNPSKYKGRNGVFVYSKLHPENVIFRMGHDEFDEDGRFICLEFSKFYLINVYMPHGGRDKSRLSYKLSAYNKLETFLISLNKPYVIVGDFNIAHSENDLERAKSNHNNIMFTKEERDALSNIISNGAEDVFRKKNPMIKQYTWWPYAFDARERNVGWRIDYLLASEGKFHFSSIELRSDIEGSDHCPIKAEFEYV